MRFYCAAINASLLFLPATSGAGELAIPAASQGPTATQKLVEQLSNDDYALRESASAGLLKLGAAALPAVRAAAQSPDPETRLRAGRLLLQLERISFEQTVDAFVGDIRGLGGNALPGWEEFRRVVGKDVATRTLFAEVYRSDPRLLDAAFGANRDDSAASNRLMALLEQRASERHDASDAGTPRSHDAVAQRLAVLTVATAEPSCVTDRAAQLVTQAARTELASVAVRETSRGHMTRRLLTRWITDSQTDDLYVLSQLLQLADRLKLRAACPLAIDIACGRRAVRPAHSQFRATALLMVGKLGDGSCVPQLRPLLEDDAVCASHAGRGPKRENLLDVEIRDVALAVILHLEGEKPRDFGYEVLISNEEKLFLMHSLAFRSVADRQSAVQQWRTGGDGRIRVAGGQAGPNVR
ncbi:MAG: hypothetical protein AAF589_05720 [Planctomycetota bacterium]